MKTSDVKIHKTNATKKKLIDYGFEEDNHHYWWASWYAKILGYKSFQTLKPTIERAKQACVELGIPVETNFIPDNNNSKNDIKLTKFACFIVALQADDKKPVVKKARGYFLNELEELNVLLSDQDYLDRMIGRSQLKNLNKQLVKAARSSKVKDFRKFMNEGYLGMYNQTMTDLKKSRGVPANENLGDYMGKTELSANIFRITMTQERLKRIKNRTENTAANQHWKIGTEIREMIIANTGRPPEMLPLNANIHKLQAKLKKAQKLLNEEVKRIE